MTNYGSNPEPPGNYPNPRNNDPWDDDAVRWLLEHLDVYERFTYGVLFECLREQPNKLNGYPERVAEADRLAHKHGVLKLAGKPIRLIRTDADAPKYPAERRSEAPKSIDAAPRIEVEPHSTGAGWTAEERILALDLYLRIGAAGRNHPAVVSLSEELNARASHPDAGTRSNLRNPNGVALKLADFAARDPSYEGTGMLRYSRGDQATWSEFAQDPDLLAESVDGIREGTESSIGPELARAGITPSSRPLEQQHTAVFEVKRTVGETTAERRESELVREFASWLTSGGVTITAHHYGPLRSDLADETTRVIWEAKSNARRSSVRMALGQLLDYLRFEDEDWQGGVLLPNEPDPDLSDLILGSGRALAWPDARKAFRIHRPQSEDEG